MKRRTEGLAGSMQSRTVSGLARASQRSASALAHTHHSPPLLSHGHLRRSGKRYRGHAGGGLGERDGDAASPMIAVDRPDPVAVRDGELSVRFARRCGGGDGEKIVAYGSVGYRFDERKNALGSRKVELTRAAEHRRGGGVNDGGQRRVRPLNAEGVVVGGGGATAVVVERLEAELDRLG